MRWWCSAVLGLACVAGASPTPDQSKLREDGTILAKGEPMFPVGVIHAGDAERRASDMQEILAGGFNVMQARLTAKDREFLDQADALNMRIIGECVDPDGPVAVVNALKDKNAVFAWNVGMEADNPKRSATEFVNFHKEVRKADPNHVTFLTLGGPSRMTEYASVADVLGMQSYPIPTKEIRSTHDAFSAAVKAATAAKRPVVAVIQAFGMKDQRPPTAQEIRAMTYLALLEGAKGVLFYAFLDKDWDMKANPDQWNEIKVLASEIQSFTPVLLRGTMKRSDPARAEDVYASIWTGGKVYVMVVNTSGHNSRKVSIQLPSNVEAKAQSQFRTRPGALNYVRGGKLEGDVAPLDTLVYMFDTQP
jgi:hypothetical protein